MNINSPLNILLCKRLNKSFIIIFVQNIVILNIILLINSLAYLNKLHFLLRLIILSIINNSITD